MAVSEQTMPKPSAQQSRLQRIWASLSIILESRIAVAGLVIILFWIFVAIFAPLLTPYTPTEQDYTAQNQGPTARHPLGTDSLGRDLWARLIYGARVVLVMLPVTEDFWLPLGTAIWGVLLGLLVGST
ncbi:MAG: ABC transporter permease, partial [Anaerolineae bacterium]